jgi:hypothetical protein
LVVSSILEVTRLLKLLLVIVLAIPATTFAQKSPQAEPAPQRWTISPRTGAASEGWPRDPVPRFTIPPRGTVGLPLPQIGLPLPPHGLSPEQSFEHGVDRGGHGRRHRRPPVTPWPAAIYVVPEYIVPNPEPVPIPVVDQPVATGRLILDAQPDGAQVFVDGYYAGVPEDFNAERGGGVLEAGEHRIDVTAPGHQSLSVLLRLAPEQTITYRGVLERIPVPAPKAAPSTFYLIPGCYMGNIPPKDARLPASCDLRRAVEFKY